MTDILKTNYNNMKWSTLCKDYEFYYDSKFKTFLEPSDYHNPFNFVKESRELRNKHAHEEHRVTLKEAILSAE
jgi:hypothetical protein